MNARRGTSVAGAVACLATLLILTAPVLIIQASEEPVSAYYTSGTIGAGGIGFLALLGIIVFLSGERGNADPATIAGISVVLSFSLVSLAVVWFLSIGETLLFGFSAQYSWLEWHPLAVIVTGLATLGASGGYAAAVLD